MKWFLAGIASISLAIGILVGASNTPVVGAFVTALFGIIVAVIGLYKEKDSDEKKIDIKTIGISFIMLAACLILGTYLGIRYRTSEKPEPAMLPWNETNKPGSVYEALDWLSVSKILKSNGFSNEEIKSIYLISQQKQKAFDSSSTNTSTYSETYPYYKMLLPLSNEGQKENSKANRGPASE